MTKSFYFITLLVYIISCNPKSTIIDVDKVRIDRVCDTIMLDFKDGKIPDAMLLIKSNTLLISSSEIDTLEIQIKQQIKDEVFTQYGEAISYDLIAERKIKDFAIKKYYALRFKKYFFKFVFSLYNGGSGWKITGFKFNEDMSDLY